MDTTSGCGKPISGAKPRKDGTLSRHANVSICYEGEGEPDVGHSYQREWSKTVAEKLARDIKRGVWFAGEEAEIVVEFGRVNVVRDGVSYVAKKDHSSVVFEKDGARFSSSVTTPFSSPSDVAHAVSMMMTYCS